MIQVFMLLTTRELVAAVFTLRRPVTMVFDVDTLVIPTLELVILTLSCNTHSTQIYKQEPN